MKKFLAVLITVAMVMSLVILPASVMPGAQVLAASSTIDVSQPVQVTSNSYYERGESIIYDGTNYWLFYGRSAGCTDSYATGNPDVNDYVVYYKKATTVAGLAGATATLISGVTHNANSFLGETGAAYFGGEVWAFATIDNGTNADLYGWWTADGGTTWNEVGPIVTGMSHGQGHHDETVFGGELWVVEGSGDFNTMHSATPKTGGWTTPLKVDALHGGLVHFFVDGSDLYLAINASAVNYIYKYNSSTVAWDLVDSNAPPNKYDPTLFKVGSRYVFAQAPWDGTKQYILQWSGATLDSNFFQNYKMVTEGAYGSNPWVDMWPIGFTDNSGDSYLFFTSERNPNDVTSEIAGNIWYLKEDWPLTNDHYTYIQEAINAAIGGETINVAAGTYTEQVVINKNLTLQGVSGAKIVRPALVNLKCYTIPESLHKLYPTVFAYGGSIASGSGTDADPYVISGTAKVNVTIDGLEVDGSNLPDGKTYSSCIMYRNVDGTISNNTTENMIPSSGSPQTFGILVYGDSTVTVSGNDVSKYTRTGIGINGDDGDHPAPDATITNNNVHADVADGCAQNGIQIGWGATGSITDNTVSTNVWTGSDWTGSGIIIASSSGVTISGNTVNNNQSGIVVVGYKQTYGKPLPAEHNVIENNTLTDNEWSISVQAYSNDTTIQNNTITGATGDGIDFDGYINMWGIETSTPDGALVKGNSVSVNSDAECMYIYTANNISVEGNTFTGGEYGIIAAAGDADGDGNPDAETLTIGGASGKENHFSGQSSYALALQDDPTDSTSDKWVSDVDASYNDWGVYTDTDVASKKIKDKVDDSSVGKACFYPYWDGSHWHGYINVTSPAPGGIYGGGTLLTVDWDNNDCPSLGSSLAQGAIRIFFYDGSGWRFVADLPRSATSYNYALPSDVDSANCKIKVSNYDTTTGADIVLFTTSAFRVVPPAIPQITVTAPAASEVVSGNSPYTIQWTSQNISSGVFRIYWFDGTSWHFVGQTACTGDGSYTYTWTVPNNNYSNCKIRIWNVDSGKWMVYGESGTFSISGGTVTEPTISVSKPAASDTVTGGTGYDINWTPSNITSGVFRIYWFDGASWHFVGQTTDSSATTFSWSVPNANYSNCKIRIWNVDSGKWVVYGESGTFSISSATTTPSINVTQPGDGDSLAGGDTEHILWTPHNISSSSVFRIYWFDGTSWHFVGQKPYSASGDYAWTVPTGNYSNCVIRIWAVDGTSWVVKGESGTFSISSAAPTPSISVTEPHSGETVTANAVKEIDWSATSVSSGSVFRIYWFDGTSWHFVGQTACTGDGNYTYNWTAPSGAYSDCVIRIWNVDSGIWVVKGESDTFSISP